MGINSQLLYNIFYRDGARHQVGLSGIATWSPTSFLNADFEIGLAVSAAYDSLNNTSNLNFGLVLGLTGDILRSHPIRWRGF